MGCSSSVPQKEKNVTGQKHLNIDISHDCSKNIPEHRKMDLTCQRQTDLRHQRLGQSVVSLKTVEKNQDDCLQEMRAVTEDAVEKLQQRLNQSNKKNPNEEDVYIKQICHTMELTLILLKDKMNAPKPMSRPAYAAKAVKPQDKEVKSPGMIDSSSSEFKSLTFNLCNALLMRLLLKYSKKKQTIYLRHSGNIWKRLSRLVLAKVEIGDRDFMVIKDNIDDIAKAMIKDLLQIFVTPENLMRAVMISDDPIFDQAVINFLNREVEARKKKKTGLARCFEKMRNAFCCC